MGTMIDFVIPALALIGAIVVILPVALFAREFVRAARQALRVATVSARIEDRRSPGLALWWAALKYEFGHHYDWLIIGPYKVPRDPSARITRDVRFYTR